MITKEKISKCAQSIVRGMSLKYGNSVVIRGGTHTQELLEEISILSLKEGSQPLIIATSDIFSKRVFDEIPAQILKETPKHYLAAIRECDVYIVVEPFQDPKIQTFFPREKIAARTEANIPIRKTIYGEGEKKGKRWTYAGWPTQEASRFYGVDFNDLERMIIEGMMVSPQNLKKHTSEIARRIEGCDMLHIFDNKGTDFTCRIENRRINEDDGVVDELDIQQGDLGNNLPAGEVFIAPYETVGEGVIFCPITIDRLTNKIIRDVTLHFKDGRLLLNECDAGRNADQLIDSFRLCLEIDKEEEEVRTTNIAELGIGCNPAIDKAIGYILTDEKLNGSVHIAFGSNLSYGGTSKSCMHWDFVTDSSATIKPVGKEDIIMQEGRLV